MADNKINDDNITGKNNTKANIIKVKHKKDGGFFVVFTFFISLCVAIAVGYLYYNNTLYQNNLSNLNTKLTMLNNSMNATSQDMDNKLSIFANTLNLLESQVNTSNNKNFLLLQLNELIGMANQSLVVYNDVKSTLKLLNYALNLLSSSTDAQYVEIKTAINTDVANLEQQQYIDPIFLVSKLNNIANQITSLPLLNYKDNISTNSGDTNISATLNNVNLSLWDKFWNNFKKDIKSIVIISNTDPNKEIQLLPSKEIIIRQNIQLYILNVKIALLQRDDNGWKSNLNNINNDLSMYFNKTSITDALSTNLQELSNINIKAPKSNIDATLKALNKLNSLQ